MWKPATNTRSVASMSRTRWRPMRRVSMLGPLMGNTGGKPMAKKARKKASKKSRKKAAKKSAVTRTKTKVSKARKVRKSFVKPVAKKSKAKRTTKRARKSKPKTFGQRVASAFSVVSDTVTGTDKLRNKMEPPATSETE